MDKTDYNLSKLTQIEHDYEKLAIFTSTLPKPLQQKLFQQLKDNEVIKLVNAMSSLKKCSREKVNAVLKEFHDLLTENEEIIFHDNKGRDFVIESLGQDRAKQLFGQVINTGSKIKLESLELVDARTLSNFLLNEHPQTITLILAHLDNNKKIDVLKRLPEALQAEIVLRTANLDYVSPEDISQLDDILKTEFRSIGTMNDTKLGGIDSVIEILDNLDKATSANILARLEEKDPELTDDVRKLMFTFDHLIYVDDKGIQELLRKIDNNKLLKALKGANEGILEKFYKNMSNRASNALKEDLKDLGQIKKSDQETARSEIVKEIKNLEALGKATIGKGSEEIYV